jgi:hypothetical protein
MEPAARTPGPEQTTSAPAEVGPWRCAADPSVETYLRCGRCDTPICPRCLIQTPVGSRCRTCAHIKKLPMFTLSPLDFLTVTGIALAASIVCGVVVAFALHLAPFLGILRFFLMAGLGYAVGEALLRFTRKRGTIVGVIAGLSVVVGVIVGQAAFFVLGGADPVLAIAVSAFQSFLSIWSLLYLAVAAVIAFTRVR